MSDETSTECVEVSGKTIKMLSINQGRIDGTEVLIDFTDGTSFSLSVVPQQKTEANLLICGGPGEPELLRKYDVS